MLVPFHTVVSVSFLQSQQIFTSNFLCAVLECRMWCRALKNDFYAHISTIICARFGCSSGLMDTCRKWVLNICWSFENKWARHPQTQNFHKLIFRQEKNKTNRYYSSLKTRRNIPQILIYSEFWRLIIDEKCAIKLSLWYSIEFQFYVFHRHVDTFRIADKRYPTMENPSWSYYSEEEDFCRHRSDRFGRSLKIVDQSWHRPSMIGGLKSSTTSNRRQRLSQYIFERFFLLRSLV